jgi:signal transduction histidine kinase
MPDQGQSWRSGSTPAAGTAPAAELERVVQIVADSTVEPTAAELGSTVDLTGAECGAFVCNVVDPQHESCTDNARLYGASNQTEAELRLLNETLEQRLASAIAERRRLEEALRQSQKMQAIGELTVGVAHDFNNLLHVVLGNLDLLRRRAVEQGTPATQDWLRLIDSTLRGGQRAAALTRRLLALSSHQPPDPKPTDVNKVVSGMSDLLRRTLGETIAVETVAASGLGSVLVDSTGLESAILNLAVNARDAMPQGGRLTIETANVLLDAAVAARHGGLASGRYALVSVSDTGTGMTKDVVARAFDPFFTTKKVGQGTGLGLSQVYGFVKQSGGHVSIDSEPGRGTTVKLYLPRLSTEQPTLHPPSSVLCHL